MASAEIIGAAIGILLMMIVAYLLVGSTLTAAEIVTTAQKDVTLQNEMRLHTSIKISSFTYPGTVNFTVNNTGSEPIVDFSHMDIFLNLIGGSGLTRFTFGSGAGLTWAKINISPDGINPGQLDPGEIMYGGINSVSQAPDWIKVITGNGIYDSRYI